MKVENDCINTICFNISESSYICEIKRDTVVLLSYQVNEALRCSKSLYEMKN